MSKKDPQPAKKSYFFGPGFHDIARAVRESWGQNAKTARKAYGNYQKKGFMTFSGQYNLFVALSVVTFGTIFFGVISAAALVIILLFFALVYLGFSAVWLLDRAYLHQKKIFTACNECKSKFLIPTYLCPKCGACHTNLTASSYGILKRTCQCGHKLPTTFFNGRRHLQAICPACRRNGKTTVLTDRESRPFCIPVVGGRSVGKTAYITAFSKLFVEQVAPSKGMEIEFYNQTKKDIYTEIKADYASGSTRMTQRSHDLDKTSAVSFSFFVKHRKLRPERLVHIYDIAGEVFTDNSENEVQRQYEYCQGIIFVIDPFSIPIVRARYGNLLALEDKAGIGMANINAVINTFLNKLREVTGLSDQKMSRVPIAVVLSKTDSAGIAKLFSEEQIKAIQDRQPDRNLDRYDAMDILCREFLRTNDMSSVISTIELKFKFNRFFAVSAIGHPRDHGAYAPVGVLEPVAWICQRADRGFYGLWGEHTFSDKSVGTEMEET